MKKILGISLCALFAVSAANANIASQEYVEQVVGAIDTSGIQTNATAINGLTTRVAANESAIGTNTTNIQTNAGDINDLKERVDGHDESIATNAANISTNTTNIAANTTAISGINTTIDGMDANVTGSHFIQGVSQANGKVTPTGKNFETTLNETTNDNAPTSKAVATYVGEQVSGLNVTALTGRVTTLEGKVGTNETNISTNTTNIGTNTQAIADLNTTIEGLELRETTGNYVRVVSQAGGQVSATPGTFEGELNSGTTDNAPTSKAVANYVADNAIQSVRSGTNNGTIIVDETEVSVGGLKSFAYKDKVASGDINAGAIMNADISGTAAIESSKIAFSDVQKTVFGSGINSGHVAQISTNARNITDMGTQVTTNKENITDLQGRMTTAETKIGNNADAISAINSILNATGTEACNTAAGCTLVHDSTGFKWEAVKR